MSAGLTPDLGDPDVLARLFAPAAGHKIIGLAVSGGPDSLALMLLAQRWAATANPSPQLIVYSLDHGLRAEARDEVAMVLDYAASLGLAARGLAWTDEKPETGLQEAARQARYRINGRRRQKGRPSQEARSPQSHQQTRRQKGQQHPQPGCPQASGLTPTRAGAGARRWRHAGLLPASARRP